MTNSKSFPLPDDWRDAVLVGRLDLGEGPTPVVVKEGRVFDVSATAPTTAQLLEKWTGTVPPRPAISSAISAFSTCCSNATLPLQMVTASRLTLVICS